MTNIIYQYWDGAMTSGAAAGSLAMKQYADRIGAEYVFEHSPRFVTDLGQYSPHYGQFKVVYDRRFSDYDNILYADIDVFPVDNLFENIFEGFQGDVGMCTEPFQPKSRLTNASAINSANDEKWSAIIKREWNVDLPRTEEGLLKVYNSGVVLYSRAGLDKMKERFVPFKWYVDFIERNGLPNFYGADQNYLHAMLEVCSLDYVELDNGWNSYVHYVGDSSMNPRPVHDSRTPDTKFVHIQLRAADHFDADKLWRITNRPYAEWAL